MSLSKTSNMVKPDVNGAEGFSSYRREMVGIGHLERNGKYFEQMIQFFVLAKIFLSGTFFFQP